MLKQTAFLSIFIILTSFVLACEPELDPAPEDINGVAHWLWAHYDDADDASLADAIDKVYSVVDFANYSEDSRGLLRDLSAEELTVVEMQDRDPKPAQGMYLVNMFDCELPKLEKIMYGLNQGENYSEIYDSYERQYTSSLDDYLSRSSKTISWTFTYEATPLPSARYRASSNGGLRYLGTTDEVQPSHGPVILQRTWMPQPAEYLETDANVFDLDFQMEIFFEPEPGRIAHFCPFWRHMAYNGVGASTDDNWVIDKILDGFRDWDARTAELCAQP